MNCLCDLCNKNEASVQLDLEAICDDCFNEQGKECSRCEKKLMQKEICECKGDLI